MTSWAGPVIYKMDNRCIDFVVPEPTTQSQVDGDGLDVVKEDASGVPPLTDEYVV